MVATASIRTAWWLGLLAASCAGCASLEGAGSAGSGGSATTSQGNSQGNGTTASGEACGNQTCNPASEYCGFEPGTCDGPKTCHPYGFDCNDVDAACGCDGNNYAGACAALHEAGGIRGVFACAPPPGKFNCTYQGQVPILCDAATQFCDVTPAAGTYGLECKPIGPCEGRKDGCVCMHMYFGVCAENFCGQDPASGGVTVFCPG